MKIIKKEQNYGVINNKSFYGVAERISRIMNKLETINTFSYNDFSEISAQTKIILRAIRTVENIIDKCLNKI